jgi:hypothetical protein
MAYLNGNKSILESIPIGKDELSRSQGCTNTKEGNTFRIHTYTHTHIYIHIHIHTHTLIRIPLESSRSSAVMSAPMRQRQTNCASWPR